MTLAIPAPLNPAVVALALLLLHAGTTLAQTLEPPQEITLDLDGDGKTDRAVLLAAASDDGSIDLHVHLGSNSGNEPDVVKQAISDERILAFESRERGTLSLTTCYGCGASKSSEETLTVVWREGTLLVGGYTRDWEWYTPFADGTDELLMGGCRIDFLTGQAWTSKDLDAEEPVDKHYKPISLRDWSSAVRPDICEFQPDMKKKRL